MNGDVVSDCSSPSVYVRTAIFQLLSVVFCHNDLDFKGDL